MFRFLPANSVGRPSKSEADLTAVLGIYQREFRGDCHLLLNQIGSEQFWRFFIDGDLQKSEMGWLGFEFREHGYLLAMMKAFQTIFAAHDDMNEYIKELHLLAATNVAHVHYDSVPEEKRGCYRYFNGIEEKITGCSMFNNYSYAGINEIVERVKLHKEKQDTFLPLILAYDYDINSIQTVIAPEFITNMAIGGKPMNIKKADATTCDDLIQLMKIKTNMVMIIIHLPLGKSGEIIANGPLVSQFVEQRILFLIKNFEEAKKKIISKYEMLKEIIKFIKECELFHSFFDCNTRVFSMSLKNYLFVTNGFPPMICDFDPNEITGYTVDELAAKYIHTMNLTLDLARGVEPFDIQLKDIMSQLSQVQQEYFSKVLDEAKTIERQGIQPSHSLTTRHLGGL